MADPKVIDALKKISKEGGKLFLITNDGCPGCDEAKEILKKEIDDRLITVANYQESDDAVRITAALNISEVPNIIAKYPDKVCLIDETTGEVAKCAKGAFSD